MKSKKLQIFCQGTETFLFLDSGLALFREAVFAPYIPGWRLLPDRQAGLDCMGI